MARGLSMYSFRIITTIVVIGLLGLAVETYAFQPGGGGGRPPQAGQGGRGGGQAGRGQGRGRFQGRGAQARGQARPTQAQRTNATQQPVTQSVPTEWSDNIKWRSIGPANMSGRITSISVFEKDPNVWWASSASGGLLKTVNNGVNFEHQFDDQATVSIGEVAVSQLDQNVVWVGTGENNPRNSVSWGDGVYKSTDGGKTWKNMGLKKTFQTGALAIHPENHDVVYVGSLGRLWGPNEERGLFKTTDGGETWEKVLYVNDMTGVIDVQINPKKPDELLVATYERQRDGFDGNDPMKKYGEGSAIYKSVDAGKTFTKITEGLPSCKLGRIGLDFYRKDPRYVYAIIESEKIAKVPENAAYSGITGADTDVGARITAVTKDGPGDKAGLKKDDIIVSIDGKIVHGFNDLMSEIRKHESGEKSKLVVSRDKEIVKIDMEFDKAPQRNGRSRVRNPFTGTLGGQAANLQDQQGKDGHEYGGIYMSADGGDSWKRINSLNPRPMYYSHIRVDPSDRNYLYVCGTSLYRSKDGGKTFTGDGGSDGIHVDHHALWIDARDGRHMILGNDGGIHVTYDRMTHWDHHNHVAIGQFYHVGVGPELNYRVYGGLQDNGSWGGPSRTSGSGAVNSDWFRVGGGDGFITLVDKYDPDQIYFESQNGGMGRNNLRTGERGFIRPRAPRGSGIRYRFNWKSPFILSPHNSKVFYSAGNYVFKSYNKGDSIEAISPEITNSDKGAGSALTQSHVDAKVLYAGTTDGAVWMTKDGGKEWIPLFHEPDSPEADEEDDESVRDKAEEADSPAKAAETSGESKAAAGDAITGNWTGVMQGEQARGREFQFSLKLGADGKVSGSVEGRQGSTEFEGGTFDKATGKISWTVEGGRSNRDYEGTLKDGKISGVLSVGDRFQIDFEATRDKTPSNQVSLVTAMSSQISMLYVPGIEDPVSGEWTGVVENDDIPGGKLEFTIELKLKDKIVTGRLVSPMGESEIVEGSYNAEKKKLVFYAEGEQGGVDIESILSGEKMTGTVEVNDGAMTIDFVATRVKKEAAEATETNAAPAVAADAPQQDVEKEKPAENEEVATQEPAAADIVSGVWTGTMESPRGASDFTMTLKKESNKKITGSYETERFESEITAGTFNPETGQMNLTSESDRFSVDFDGKIVGNKFTGEMNFNGGAFTMEIDATRTTAARPSGATSAQRTNRPSRAAAAPTGTSLKDLLPGPRWVSSLEASHFKAGRCYASFDGHRSDDDGVYVFVTEDYGQTWKSLKANLPDSAGSVRVVREDVKNENLLFLGCEFSAWFSIDRGQSWTRFTGLPTVAVHEFAIHPKAGEVVAGTHGRSLWIADIRVLRQMSQETIAKDAHLYDPGEIIQWRRGAQRGSNGTREFQAENPSAGIKLCYNLGKRAREIELKVTDIEGKTIREFADAPLTTGFHAVDWDLRRASRGGAQRGGGRRGFGGATVPTGNYLVTLTVDGNVQTQTFSIKQDPNTPADAIAVDEELEFWLEMMEEGGGND